MPEPLTVVFYTGAGELEVTMTEEEIEKLPDIKGVIEPKEGRPRLAAALLFWAQRQILGEAEMFNAMDERGCFTTVRTSAISGAKVLEPIDPDAKKGLSAIGFGRRA